MILARRARGFALPLPLLLLPLALALLLTAMTAAPAGAQEPGDDPDAGMLELPPALLGRVIVDAARRTRNSPGDIELIGFERVSWGPDACAAALGTADFCEADETRGYEISVRSGDEALHYDTDLVGNVITFRGREAAAEENPEAPAEPAPGPTAAPGSSGTYSVQPGDALHSIAFRFGTSVSAMARLNGIIDPNRIYAGDVLHIPRTVVPPPLPQQPFYFIQPGDTLARIALRTGSTVSAIAALNRIPNPHWIVAGTYLLIPLQAPPPAEPTAPTAPATQTPTVPDPPTAPDGSATEGDEPAGSTGDRRATGELAA